MNIMRQDRFLNTETFLWEGIKTRELPTTASQKSFSRYNKRFLKGPIPLHLLQQATKLPGACLAIYLAVCHRVDLSKSNTVTLSQAHLKEWGISGDRYHRAVNHLSEIGLISLKKEVGRATRITLLQS